MPTPQEFDYFLAYNLNAEQLSLAGGLTQKQTKPILRVGKAF